MTTKAEQETTIRWDQEDRTAHLWTAYEPDAREWEQAGYPVRVDGRDREGRPTGWATQLPAEAIRYRRVQDGQVVKRRGHGKGRLFQAVEDDQLVAVEQ